MYNKYADIISINRELAEIWPGWTVTRLIGEGSGGAVYEISKTVASKQEKAAMRVIFVPKDNKEIDHLSTRGITNEKIEAYYDRSVDSIRREIHLMQEFADNAHFVSYRDYSIHKKKGGIGADIFIQMELLTELAEYMAKNSFSERTILRLGMDLAQGLIDCHKKGIVHGNIKPQNIFVSDSGDFKLGDLGRFRSAIVDRQDFQHIEALAYAAPEAHPLSLTDVRSDIYSLGVVLYQCLNDNRLPYDSVRFSLEENTKAENKQLAAEPTPDPENGSNRLEFVVQKAVALKPEDRFQTAEEMYNALKKVYASLCDTEDEEKYIDEIGGFTETPTAGTGTDGDQNSDPSDKYLNIDAFEFPDDQKTPEAQETPDDQKTPEAQETPDATTFVPEERHGDNATPDAVEEETEEFKLREITINFDLDEEDTNNSAVEGEETGREADQDETNPYLDSIRDLMRQQNGYRGNLSSSSGISSSGSFGDSSYTSFGDSTEQLAVINTVGVVPKRILVSFVTLLCVCGLYFTFKNETDDPALAILFSCFPLVGMVLIFIPRIPFLSAVLCAVSGYLSGLGSFLFLPLLYEIFGSGIFLRIAEFTTIKIFIYGFLCTFNAITAVRWLYERDQRRRLRNSYGR